jgi:HD-like signal output (HDOD) protein
VGGNTSGNGKTMAAILAPRSVEGWARRLGEPEIPVMRRTVRALARLRRQEEEADSHGIARIVLADPLMTLKLLRRIVARRSRRIVTDTETVTAAVLLLGVPPFFREFDGQAVAEDCFAGRASEYRGLLALLRRSGRAALLAVGLAVLRQDTDTELIYEAAMLDEFAGLLLWCHEPDIAADIARRQRADPSLRSARIQRELLGVELAEVQQYLLKRWQMPAALIRLTDPQDRTPRARNVRLAVQLARHLDGGWSNPAIPDDLEEVGALLNISPAAARRKVEEILA